MNHVTCLSFMIKSLRIATVKSKRVTQTDTRLLCACRSVASHARMRNKRVTDHLTRLTRLFVVNTLMRTVIAERNASLRP